MSKMVWDSKSGQWHTKPKFVNGKRVDEPAPEPVPVAKAKRKRRTKAQIEADKVAKLGTTE